MKSINSLNGGSRTILGIQQAVVFLSNTSPDLGISTNYNVPFSSLPIGNNTLIDKATFAYNPVTDTLTVGYINGVAKQVIVTDSNFNGNLKMIFSDGANNLLDNADLTYNPYTKTLTVPNISGAVVGSATSIAITDIGDNTDYYLVFTDSAGSSKTLNVNETASPADTFTYNPSTNKLSVLSIFCGYCESENFIGNGSQLTDIQTSALDGVINNGQLQYSFITIGTSPINLGNTTTELFGLTDLRVGTLRITDGAIRDTDGTITFDTTNLVGLGRLGFGPDSVVPDAKIDVGSNDEYVQGIFKNRNATNPGQIVIRNIAYDDQIQIRSKYDGGDNHIFTYNGVGTSNLRLNNSMMLLGTGNVGIGTITPTKRLQVVGTPYGIVNSTHFDLEIGDHDATNYFKMVSLGTDQNGSYNSGGISIWQNGSTEAIRFSGGLGRVNYINNGGNMGIGTDLPHYRLDLGLSYGPIGSAAAKKLSIYNNGGNDFYGLGIAGGTLEFHANNLSTGLPQMVLLSTGNVGIGITTPSQKLDVYGKSVFGSDSTFNIILHLGSVLYNSNQNFAKNCMYHDNNVNPYGLFIANTNSAGAANKEASILFGIADTANNVKTGISICAVSNDANVVSSDLVFKTKSIYPIQNGYSVCSESMRINRDGNVGIGIAPDPAYKLEVLGQIKCGNPANGLTAIDIDINSGYAYGMYIGGWSAGGRTNGNATIEVSSNLHIDSPSNGAIGGGNIYLNYYNAGWSTVIRNRIDISDRRIKKDIIEIETQEQFNETFEIIKKVGSYKYKYRDTYRENDLDQYGFIAQEVLEHYPVAYKLAGNNCYLPNIMETLNFTYEVGDDNEYTFNIEGYDLDVNIKYLFYAFREGVEQFDYLENIEPITNNTFIYTPTIIKNQEPPTYIKLVLVGTYTDDKLGVSKDRLFQLGFAGVRGLIAENESLKQRLDAIEKILDATTLGGIPLPNL